MDIAVLGGGNGSFAAAADFALAGHNVRLWRRDEPAVRAHIAAGGKITLIDKKGRQETTPALITSDLAAAIKGAALIVCPAPAFAQEDIAKQIAPLLRDGQVVYLPPGTFGSFVFANAAFRAGNKAEVAYAETGTLPWLARKLTAYEVRVSGRGVRLPTGVFPERLSAHALKVIGGAFPKVIEGCGDALSGALMNAGPIIHPPLITMNAGPIEHFEHWDIHKEGTQPAIRRVTDALDRERIAVREAFGYGYPHFPLADHYAKSGDIWMYGRNAHEEVTDSGDWREHLVLTEHRYMFEDTKIGLSLLVSFGELAKVRTPLARAFLAIGSAITGEDFLVTGRTRERLGLADVSLNKVRTILKDGLK